MDLREFRPHFQNSSRPIVNPVTRHREGSLGEAEQKHNLTKHEQTTRWLTHCLSYHHHHLKQHDTESGGRCPIKPFLPRPSGWRCGRPWRNVAIGQGRTGSSCRRILRTPSPLTDSLSHCDCLRSSISSSNAMFSLWAPPHTNLINTAQPKS